MNVCGEQVYCGVCMSEYMWSVVNVCVLCECVCLYICASVYVCACACWDGGQGGMDSNNKEN